MQDFRGRKVGAQAAVSSGWDQEDPPEQIKKNSEQVPIFFTPDPQILRKRYTISIKNYTLKKY